MKANFNDCITLVLTSEGGFSNHPTDPGKMTNLGVTAQTWSDWRLRPATGPVTESEMRALTPEDVIPLYREVFWDKIRGDDLTLGIDYAVFDYAVNSHPSKAARDFQLIVGATQDGIIGPKTLACVAALRLRYQLTWAMEKVCAYRLAYLKTLPNWPVDGNGWTDRVNRVRADAQTMILSLPSN